MEDSLTLPLQALLPGGARLLRRGAALPGAAGHLLLHSLLPGGPHGGQVGVKQSAKITD